MVPLESELKKDWHCSVTGDRRVQQIQKLIMCMQLPYNDSIQNNELITSNAKLAEKEMFKNANSRSEYYYMLAEKIYKFQRELEQERAQMMACDSPSSTCITPSHHWPAASRGSESHLFNEKREDVITQELGHKYTTKYKEDLKPSHNMDVSPNVAKEAAKMCYDKNTPSSSSMSTSHDDQIVSRFVGVVGNVWQGENGDEELNKEMLQLLIGIENNSLGQK